jgi:hypothetical protein
MSLALGTRLLSLVGDTEALDERVDQLIAIATDHGLALWRAQGTIFRGWVKVKNGDVTEGISASAQQFHGLPRHRDAGVDALFYRSPCQGICLVRKA